MFEVVTRKVKVTDRVNDEETDAAMSPKGFPQSFIGSCVFAKSLSKVSCSPETLQLHKLLNSILLVRHTVGS